MRVKHENRIYTEQQHFYRFIRLVRIIFEIINWHHCALGYLFQFKKRMECSYVPLTNENWTSILSWLKFVCIKEKKSPYEFRQNIPEIYSQSAKQCATSNAFKCIQILFIDRFNGFHSLRFDWQQLTDTVITH